jgi:HD superfamily phosphohydrolase
MDTNHRKVIKDCIYGYIYVPSLCLSFIDTPEFQRLRRVRQLGMVHYTYPSASHTRFEHSLGVMHLAGIMVDQLRNYAPISDRTKDLIQLAGLYHDVGHFAYSHLFDIFLSQQSVDSPGIFKLHHHEDRSVFFLKQVNSRLSLLSAEEETFVCDAILGNIPDNQPHYLYQIVCNKECGIDVDKQDYIRRDSYHTGFPGFYSEYIIQNAVIDSDNHIAYREKVYNVIDDLFRARQRMFENVYQHHTSLKLDKLFLCMMKCLGNKLFTYGELTDDFNIETLLRSSPETSQLMISIDNRNFRHECHLCSHYHISKTVKSSGTIDTVRFV